MNDAPLISYIAAVYNKADVLAETLASLTAQRDVPGPVEFIFADDASTDGSREVLRAAAADDPRIRVIENTTNAGPAIRFNQAAAAARGKWLLPVDSDDLLPVNATAFLLDVATRESAALVFGRSRRGLEAAAVPQDATVSTHDDPLAFAAQHQIVHMGFLVAAATWRAAGGADEGIFIQDQSIPLRLAAAAPRMGFVDAPVYWLRPAGDGNLSRLIAQQHHDRYLSATAMLKMPNISIPARKALERQAISALWKLRRDQTGALAHLSPDFARYLGNRLIGIGLSDAAHANAQARLRNLPDIRRPCGNI